MLGTVLATEQERQILPDSTCISIWGLLPLESVYGFGNGTQRSCSGAAASLEVKAEPLSQARAPTAGLWGERLEARL